MTSSEIAGMKREHRSTMLKGMIAEAYPMGSNPTFTAYKILDKDFSPEVLWQWYDDMARWWNIKTLS